MTTLHPIRNVLDWSEVQNPDIERRSRFPKVWIARLSCGHKINYGAGNRPSASVLRCAACQKVEA